MILRRSAQKLGAKSEKRGLLYYAKEKNYKIKLLLCKK